MCIRIWFKWAVGLFDSLPSYRQLAGAKPMDRQLFILFIEISYESDSFRIFLLSLRNVFMQACDNYSESKNIVLMCLRIIVLL